MPDIGAKLFPNLMTMVVQLLSTGVLFLVFKKFLWSAVMDYFAKRADYIEKNMTDAKDMRDQASVFLAESEKQAQEAAVQYRDIIAQAKEDADKQKQAILADAQDQAAKKIAAARVEIETEKAQAQEEMKTEIIEIATEVAMKIMNQEISASTNDAMISEFVDEVVS